MLRLSWKPGFWIHIKGHKFLSYLLFIPKELMLQCHMVPELGLHTSHILSNTVWNTFGLLLARIKIKASFVSYYL